MGGVLWAVHAFELRDGEVVTCLALLSCLPPLIAAGIAAEEAAHATSTFAAAAVLGSSLARVSAARASIGGASASSGGVPGGGPPEAAKPTPASESVDQYLVGAFADAQRR